MLLFAVSVLVFAQSCSEVPEGLMNKPVFFHIISTMARFLKKKLLLKMKKYFDFLFTFCLKHFSFSYSRLTNKICTFLADFSKQ